MYRIGRSRAKRVANLLPVQTSYLVEAGGVESVTDTFLKSNTKAGRPQSRCFAKGKHRNKVAPVSETSGEEFQLPKFQSMMDKALNHLQHELANIRMGRATPGMLDHLKVEAYGEKMPMKSVGTVSVKNSQLLAVTVFDCALTDAVASCIAASPLGLNPMVEGQEILVPIPSPTKETIAAMQKLCKSESETAKIAIRHARKLALTDASKISSEDDRRRIEKLVQKMTDEFTDEVELIVKTKSKDLHST